MILSKKAGELPEGTSNPAADASELTNETTEDLVSTFAINYVR